VQVALPRGDTAAHSEVGVTVKRGGLAAAAAAAPKGVCAGLGVAVTTV